MSTNGKHACWKPSFDDFLAFLIMAGMALVIGCVFWAIWALLTWPVIAKTAATGFLMALIGLMLGSC